MNRRTITIDDSIYRALQKMRAEFIQSEIVDDLSFTAAVNLVLLGGLIAADRFLEDDWALLRSYLEEKRESLKLDSFTDRRAEGYLRGLENLRSGLLPPHSEEPQPKDDPLLSIVGLCQKPVGPQDASLNHDRYLYGRKDTQQDAREDVA